jgi:hypothetical protein
MAENNRKDVQCHILSPYRYFYFWAMGIYINKTLIKKQFYYSIEFILRKTQKKDVLSPFI